MLKLRVRALVATSAERWHRGSPRAGNRLDPSTGISRDRAMRRLRVAGATAALLLGWASAHATLVLGTISTEPNPPGAGEVFTLTIAMTDPTLVPIEDALVIAEFTPPEPGKTVSVRLRETDGAGVYSGPITLDRDGTYTLLLRDRTFRQEDATATLLIDIGSSEPLVPITFVFPPTATGSRNLSSWLIWLIGLPIAAAVVVTLLVLTGTKREDKAKDD